jgi:hypothetical protein
LVYALCSILLLAAAGPVSAEILTFNLSGQIGQTDPIPDGYGDVKIGSDTILHLTYREAVAFGNSASTTDDLRFQTPNYGDLSDVAYGGTEASDTVGEIRFEGLVLAGQQYGAELVSFDLAGFNREDQYDIDVKVYDENWGVVAFWDDLMVPGDTSIHTPCHLTLTLNPAVSSQALVLQWLAPWYVGIDNVEYSAVPVPEPATIVGWLIGLGCLGYVTYRRRAR